jgi:hypothetical protein
MNLGNFKASVQQVEDHITQMSKLLAELKQAGEMDDDERQDAYGRKSLGIINDSVRQNADVIMYYCNEIDYALL